MVEDQEQVDKLLHVKAQCPRLEYIVYDDPRGLRHYSEPFLMSLERLQELGSKFAMEQPDLLRGPRSPQGAGDDIAIICYTSGTTGVAQGRHALAPEPDRHRANAVDAARACAGTTRCSPTCPWRGWATTCSPTRSAILTGFTINCPESAATVLHDLREIGPTYFFAPPRIWESILTKVMIRIEDAAWAKRQLVHFFLDAGPGIERRRLTGRPVPLGSSASCTRWGVCWSTGR